MKARIAAVLITMTAMIAMTGCAAPSGSSMNRQSAVGSSTVPPPMTDMAGQTHDLKTVVASGRKAVLVFWQTWCVPCRREGPALAAAARAHAGSHDFFGVVTGPDSMVDEPRVLSLADEMGLGYPQIRDRDASLAKRYAIESTPTILVLGNGGKVLYRGHHAPTDWNRLR